jgi:hypothetical protein
MPTDAHSQAHTGTYGLFDDPDEFAQVTSREEAHEIQRLQGQIRRQKRRDRRLDRKDEKAAKRAAAGKESKSRITSLFGKFFGVKSSESIHEPAQPVDSDDEDRQVNKSDGKPAYMIVRRSVTPKKVYHVEDVDTSVNSLWLSECGMVKVKSDDVGGYHIVSKTDIEKSD